MNEKKKILITVKSYPVISEKYHEVVCTAGVDSHGNFFRLYPFPYRSLDYYQQFRKYQWVEVDVKKNNRDPRPESYKIYPKSINLGEHLSDWRARSKVIFQNPPTTMCALNSVKNRTIISLGIIKPLKIADLIITPRSTEWTPRVKAVINRALLIEPHQPSPQKTPFHFKYRYYCQEPGCKSHTQTIEDWEIHALYRKLRLSESSEKNIVDKIKQKYFDKFSSTKFDTHFFVGMHSKHQAWLIIGVYYPPNQFPTEKKGQATLWPYLNK